VNERPRDWFDPDYIRKFVSAVFADRPLYLVVQSPIYNVIADRFVTKICLGRTPFVEPEKSAHEKFDAMSSPPEWAAWMSAAVAGGGSGAI
jgi:hypothetical protein